MKSLKMIAAATAVALGTLSASALAGEEALNADAFVKKYAGKDGMVSKAEMMKQVEKMFDKADTQKMGKLDKKQVEIFLRELMKNGA
jgi:hypothetical protein